MRALPASLTAVVVLASAAACSSSKPAARTPQISTTSIEIHGAVTVVGNHSARDSDATNSPCYTLGNSPLLPQPDALDAVKQGAQAVITDDTGRTVGVGALSGGHTVSLPPGTPLNQRKCQFDFTATVPGGHAIYGVRVGSLTPVQFRSTDVATAQVTYGP
jgi:hypothetical protein